MYQFLRKRFSPAVANGLMALWYALLIFLVLVFFNTSPGEFRYINL